MDNAKRNKSVAYILIVASSIFVIFATVLALSQDPPNYGALIFSLLLVVGLYVFIDFMKILRYKKDELNNLEEELDSDVKK